MKIILIDDEQLMLNLIEKKITELTSNFVLGTYTNPHQGLIEISKQQPDVVFLDISMPKISGIDLAREIKTSMPAIKIVFLTAYDAYAIDAFDLDAEDYLLKPINDNRLLQTFAKLTNTPVQQAVENKPYICCFNHLYFLDNGPNGNVVDVKWRTVKAREIFAFLLQHRGTHVQKDIVVDYFWPNENVKQAYAQLYSAIYQIRKTLSTIEYDIQIISAENTYKLDVSNCDIDVDIFENGIDDMPFITKDNIEVHKELLLLYTGDYFDDEDFVWSTNERHRLRVKWLYHVKRVAEFYMYTSYFTEAILVYLQLQKISPFYVESYFMLMKLYDKIDDRYAVKEQLKQLTHMLSEEFGEEPRDEILDWYHSWSNHSAINHLS